jgi:hypothetical protein
MKNKTLPLTNPQLSLLIVLLAFLLGGWFRFLPAFSAGFPPNDGGMFYVIIEDILANNFLLPATTTYNQLQIPLAYPPLSFYLAAALTRMGISPLQALLWMPPFFATASILLVFRLAHVMLKDPLKASVAALLYALAPASHLWLLMGGGLTRAPGFFFLLLTVTASYQLFWEERRSAVWQTILAAALTVLTHPEMLLHAVALPVTFFLFRPHWNNFKKALWVALGVLILSSPWWATVLLRWGVSPFLNAPQTGYYNLLWAIYQITAIKMVSESPFSLLAMAGLLGLFGALSKKEWLIPAFLLAPYLVNPRNASVVALVPWSILAAQFLLAQWNESKPSAWWRAGAVAYLLFLNLTGAYLSLLHFSQTALQPPLVQAMQWTKDNLPPQSRFLVLTGNPSFFSDPVTEWFPALTGQHSISTVQGREWIQGDTFFAYTSQIQSTQACYWKDAACLQKETQGLPAFNFLFLPKKCTPSADCEGILATQTSPLYTSLLSAQTPLVFENDSVAIFTFANP